MGRPRGPANNGQRFPWPPASKVRRMPPGHLGLRPSPTPLPTLPPPFSLPSDLHVCLLTRCPWLYVAMETDAAVSGTAWAQPLQPASSHCSPHGSPGCDPPPGPQVSPGQHRSWRRSSFLHATHVPCPGGRGTAGPALPGAATGTPLTASPPGRASPRVSDRAEEAVPSTQTNGHGPPSGPCGAAARGASSTLS